MTPEAVRFLVPSQWGRLPLRKTRKIGPGPHPRGPSATALIGVTLRPACIATPKAAPWALEVRWWLFCEHPQLWKLGSRKREIFAQCQSCEGRLQLVLKTDEGEPKPASVSQQAGKPAGGAGIRIPTRYSGNDRHNSAHRFAHSKRLGIDRSWQYATRSGCWHLRKARGT